MNDMNEFFNQFIYHPWVFLRGFVGSFFLSSKPMREPVDFVVTWVDGNDEVWRQEKRRCEEHVSAVEGLDKGSERYRNWDLFFYWFRAVEQYAPWVNKVYLVTCGHVPSWLEEANEKLVVVKHSDFIPAQWLPTFNSLAIELNMHRIEGLSEHFVYFNDDTILTDHVRPEDFFQDGKPLVCSSAAYVLNSPDNGVFNHQLFSATGLMNVYNWQKVIEKAPAKWFYHRYGVKLRYSWDAYKHEYLTGVYYTHMPQAFRKSTMEKVWENHCEQLSATCSHRFRTPMDVSHQVVSLQEIVDGDYVPMPRHHYGRIWTDIGTDKDLFADDIRHHRDKIVCVHDNHNITAENFETVRNTVAQAFEDILPSPCSFEKREEA